MWEGIRAEKRCHAGFDHLIILMYYYYWYGTCNSKTIPPRTVPASFGVYLCLVQCYSLENYNRRTATPSVHSSNHNALKRIEREATLCLPMLQGLTGCVVFLSMLPCGGSLRVDSSFQDAPRSVFEAAGDYRFLSPGLCEPGWRVEEVVVAAAAAGQEEGMSEEEAEEPCGSVRSCGSFPRWITPPLLGRC